MTVTHKVFNNRFERLQSKIYSNRIAPTVATTPIPFDPATAVLKYLINGASSIEMNVNGSVTPVVFQYVVPANSLTRMSALFFGMLDTGMNPSDFGGIANGLTNGLLVEIRDDLGALILSMTGVATIKTNICFHFLGGANTIITTVGTDGMLIADADVTRHGGHLRLLAGWSLQVTVQDDLSSLDFFRSRIVGQVLPATI